MPGALAFPRVGLLTNPTAGRGRAVAYGAQTAATLRAAGHEVVDLSGPDEATAARRAPRGARRSRDRRAHRGRRGRHGAPRCQPLRRRRRPARRGRRGHRQRQRPRARPPGPRPPKRGGARHRAAAREPSTSAAASPGRARPAGGSASSAAGSTRSSTNGPRGCAGPAARCATTSPSPASCRVFRPIPYVITVDGERTATDAMLVAVANGPAFGGGMRVAPQAAYDDGLLDVVILHRVSRAQFVRVFPRVFKGTHVTHPRVEIQRGRRVRLEAAGIVTQADGERVRATAAGPRGGPRRAHRRDIAWAPWRGGSGGRARDLRVVARIPARPVPAWRRAARWRPGTGSSSRRPPAPARRSSASSRYTWPWPAGARRSTRRRSRPSPTRSTPTSSGATAPATSASSPVTRRSTGRPRSSS